MRQLPIACIVALATAVALPAAGQSADGPGATVAVAQQEPFGRYLVDGEGRSLYLLEEDVDSSAATNEQEPISTCYDACAEEWPPLTAEAAPEAGEGVREALLSTTERTGGATQVTYNGWPLYYYHDDKAPGDTEGQDVHDKWGGWYLLTPAGEPLEAERGGD